MNAQDREKLYDEKIAPELLRLGKLCQDNGLSFVAGVEWEPDQVGRTACLTAEAGDGMRMANHILQLGDALGMVSLTVTRGVAADCPDCGAGPRNKHSIYCKTPEAIDRRNEKAE